MHIDDRKSATRYLKIEDVPAPKIITLPLSQHIGGRAVPIVSIGQRVIAGEKIAEASGEISACLHSPVSGVVVDIAKRLHPKGTAVESVIIENGGVPLFEATPGGRKGSAIGDCGSGSLISGAEGASGIQEMGGTLFVDRTRAGEENHPNILREMGVVGMGGGGFPTDVKLNPPEGEHIKTVIINGAECEPYLTSDHRIMLESPAQLLAAADFIMRKTGAERMIIAIEENKRDAIETINTYVKREFPEIEVVVLPNDYPQGSERHLVRTITGEELPFGKRPLAIGVMVINVQTVLAVYNAVFEGMPLTHRVITVSGDAAVRSANLRVPIGICVADIWKYLEETAPANSNPKPLETLVLGGPMMGIAQITMDTPITKNTSAIIALSADSTGKGTETACIRCGRCVSNCPSRLRPVSLAKASRFDKIEEMRREHIVDCVECGCCTYSCPAKIHLLQWIKRGKHVING